MSIRVAMRGAARALPFAALAWASLSSPQAPPAAAPAPAPAATPRELEAAARASGFFQVAERVAPPPCPFGNGVSRRTIRC